MNLRIGLYVSFLIGAAGYTSQQHGSAPSEPDLALINATLAHLGNEAEESDEVDLLIPFIDSHPKFLEDAVFTQALENGLTKKEYKDLLKGCLKHPWKLLDESFSSDEPKELVSLKVAIKKTWEEIVTDACAAVVKKDFATLEKMIVQWPRLLNPPQGMETTVFHQAAHLFDSQKQQSVEIFSYLIRAGADATIPDKKGISVEALIKPGHNAYEAYTHHTYLKKHPSAVSKKINDTAVKARAHWHYIMGGVLTCMFLYLIGPKKNSLHKELEDVAQTRTAQLLKHENLV